MTIGDDGLVTAAHLSAVAGLLADHTRAAICVALLDGRAWTVGELARQAGVAPSTASGHVAKLTDGGLVVAEHQGRHRYVRLAGPRAVQLIEDLGAYVAAAPARAPAEGTSAAPAPARRHSLRTVSAADAMARGRTCYDHLAGRLGVRITDAMTGAGLLEQASGFALTPTGLAWLTTEFDIDVAALTDRRRPLVRSCLDWTERRPHLGGAAGAALCRRFFDRGWVTRIGSGRAVQVTPEGERGLRDTCGIHPGV